MGFVFKKAERKKVKLKIAISSPSGGGKTYSSLLLANGLCGSWEKIFVIDTENGSAELYSHLGPFQHTRLDPPYTPERYQEAIQAAVEAGAEVVIIDSISHEHEGEGGGLDIQQQLGGRFQDWQKVTPRHRKFLNAMLLSDSHIIATMRRKSDYEIVKDGSGKTSVSKVGLKEVQREGIEYEFTLHFGLGQNHLASAMKDRTGLFSGAFEFLISQATGKALKEWTESGKGIEFTGTDQQKRSLFEIFKKHNISDKEKMIELSSRAIEEKVTVDALDAFVEASLAAPATEVMEEKENVVV